MTNTPAERKDLGLMRAMFGEIAPRYDFISRVLSFGMDGRWKRLGVERATLAENAVVLDLASGTGDFSELILQRLPRARAVAVDLTEQMLRVARTRGLKETVCADGTKLPFADGTFDCVFVGYGLRNFPSLDAGLREIERVTRPGGLMVALDFFLPRNLMLRRIYLGYLFAQGAFWGLVFHGRARTYTYLPDSLKSFMTLDDFSAMTERMGYARLDRRSYVFGGIGMQWAVKR
jgi:demethylmenaquinone methyltransferase / 2-methoxy-6-polyprenyl-1,4-benzoquinol methylase